MVFRMRFVRGARRLGATALIIGLAAGATACSTEDSPAPDGIKSPDAAEPTFVGAIADLTTVECVPVDGVWTGSGELVNDDKKARRYDVKFAVINPKTSGVLGQKSLEVRVPAGKSKAIDVPGIHEGNAKNGECVQRVTRDAAG